MGVPFHPSQILRSRYDVMTSRYDVMTSRYDVITSRYDVITSRHDVRTSRYDVVTGVQAPPSAYSLGSQSASTRYRIYADYCAQFR